MFALSSTTRMSRYQVKIANSRFKITADSSSHQTAQLWNSLHRMLQLFEACRGSSYSWTRQQKKIHGRFFKTKNTHLAQEIPAADTYWWWLSGMGCLFGLSDPVAAWIAGPHPSWRQWLCPGVPHSHQRNYIRPIGYHYTYTRPRKLFPTKLCHISASVSRVGWESCVGFMLTTVN